MLPKAGFLLRPGDIAGLAAAILRLASDPALREAMGREGRQRFADQFRHETMTGRFRSLYESSTQWRLRRWSGRHGEAGRW